MLFGWADHQAWMKDTYWKERWGLYRKDGGYGADADAPEYVTNPGVMNVTGEINEYVGTFCVGDEGATFPWNMDWAADYFIGRTGTSLDTHYNSFLVTEDRLRVLVRNSIKNRRTPAVIGYGLSSPHYALAYMYAWRYHPDFGYQRLFRVNQGKSQSDWSDWNGDWIEAETWFAGEIFP